jgi:hypothetical protein
MKRVALCLFLVLVPAGGAAAKELESAKVCGASDCRTITDHKALIALVEGDLPVSPPDPSAFYRVAVRVRGDGEIATLRVVIVPSLGLMRGGTPADGYTWMPVPAESLRLQRRMTRGLEPLPASKLRGLEPRKARVDEVVLPPAEPEPEPTASSLAWPWILSALGGAAVLALAVSRLRRRPGR